MWVQTTWTLSACLIGAILFWVFIEVACIVITLLSDWCELHWPTILIVSWLENLDPETVWKSGACQTKKWEEKEWKCKKRSLSQNSWWEGWKRKLWRCGGAAEDKAEQQQQRLAFGGFCSREKYYRRKQQLSRCQFTLIQFIHFFKCIFIKFHVHWSSWSSWASVSSHPRATSLKSSNGILICWSYLSKFG